MRRMTLLGLVATLIAFGGGVLGLSSTASAAPVLTVTPNTNLTNGAVVSVSGSGFAASGIGAIVECNSDPSQPTIAVVGNAVPVSCSNPLNAVHSTNSSGGLPPTNFTVVSPTPGPPATGTDSSGGKATTDAANYPCPPTQAQINEGVTCSIGYGTSGGASASANITFQGQAAPQTIVTSVLPNAGPLAGGTSVTINGLNLSSPTAVTFGGVAATSFTAVSAKTVTAVAPASATSQTVDVQVTTTLGQSSTTSADHFTYTNAPLVYSVSPSFGPPAGGTVVTITGGQFTGTTAVDFGSTPATSFTVNSDTSMTATSPAGSGTVDVTATNAHGVSVTSSQDEFTYQDGYRLVASDGGVFTYGPLQFEGSAGNLTLNKPVVGMAVTPDGKGYWLVASDGGIFSYGDAMFYGSAGGTKLNAPIVGMAATRDGGGYWLVASDGGIFSYGDAAFHGSAGSLTLNKPVVGMAATTDGGGYWLVASDGGIFSYGDAAFFGSAGSMPLNKPVVGMASG